MYHGLDKHCINSNSIWNLSCSSFSLGGCCCGDGVIWGVDSIQGIEMILTPLEARLIFCVLVKNPDQMKS